jgi:hypothetical protein
MKQFGAEGATAPETLRQKDRWDINALESSCPNRSVAEGNGSPKE